MATTIGDKATAQFKNSSGVWALVPNEGGETMLQRIQSSTASFIVEVRYPGTTVEVLNLAEMVNGPGKLIYAV